MESKAAIAHYLKGKMITIKNGDTKVFAELGKTRAGEPGRDCVFMAQGGKEKITAVVFFDVQDGYIQRYDLCIPQLYNVVRSGVYPI